MKKPAVSGGASGVGLTFASRAHCAHGAIQRAVRGRGLLVRPRRARSSKTRSLFLFFVASTASELCRLQGNCASSFRLSRSTIHLLHGG
ncbi:uncharacterized protein LOC115679649 isoform X1 [Syzygium oleosum]|uniref:uncharacterized protein LOC115679649 isoform X1 n=1 Tax=Syzygium oleosum TaxID=219896 RepID=UPI0024BB6041|nr:uncharacterized protein LOC115679649 isoform X1 [Syzygium oleosum]